MEQLFTLIENYGIYVIFFIVMIEYACFPIPSEVVLPLAGAIGYINNIHPVIMISFATVFGLIGSLFCYFLGYYGKKKLMNKLVQNDKEIKESKSFYQKYCNFAICIGRLIPICRTYISFIAGANKHRITKYIIFTTIGITIWNTILILLGYYFYNNIDIISPYYEKYKIIILSIIGSILVFIIIKKVLEKLKLNHYKTN